MNYVIALIQAASRLFVSSYRFLKPLIEGCQIDVGYICPFEYNPPFCQYGGWTVAAVRKTNNFLCPKARPFFKESPIISSAVAVGSFVPTLRFETLEIHKVCLRISNLDLCQNLSPSTLADITSDSLNAKTLAFRPDGKKQAFLIYGHLKKYLSAGMPNLLSQFFSLENLKYTKYSCVF